MLILVPRPPSSQRGLFIEITPDGAHWLLLKNDAGATVRRLEILSRRDRR